MQPLKTNNQQLLIIFFAVLITLTVALLLVFSIRYHSYMNEFNEEKTISEQQKAKLPPPPEERYFSGIIKSVQEESFIVSLKNGKQKEVFLNEQTEVLKGEGKGIIVSKEKIQPDYHVACFLPKDKNNNTALIVHMTKKYYENNGQ